MGKHIVKVFFLVSLLACAFKPDCKNNPDFVVKIVDPASQDLKLYWKNENGEIFKTFGNLKSWLESKNKELLFAMNGGMFTPEKNPQGIYIEEFKTIIPLNRDTGYGNFYMNPNGVFYIDSTKKAQVCKTENFPETKNIRYATQSGPMLIIDGEINPKFKKGSTSLYVRNGVGILPDGRILFVMSKMEINFYDFAVFFKNKGCINALYLDGFVSQTYLPEQNWKQLDGEFGVIIGLTIDK
jgi:uncharacterized protein YigE (DUF2233 family)